ncbi:patatin-like phospholipase family protein [Microaerobacter geothermalis]|uniref:patatin-like phospholipase family protein n=1 Tax=Microaerobacter geothermalis TaxID=674972 RepID=UPI001F1F32BD|nr:patatin-like phospholipase family protein [Microaerobacter geothermalis]MCF6094172.1 patatin-like phospholipase family protein [Microaerobacter geothermalis]
MLADAVFEGGGVKVLGFLGAISILEREGYQWNRLAGTSAGAIIASLIAAGYTAREIKVEMDHLDFKKFRDRSVWFLFPVIGPGIRFAIRKGFHSGNYLKQWLEVRLRKKGIVTFYHLKEDKLKIIASDITRGKMLVMPDDIKDYGIDPHNLKVADAVRMSCSIPFYFDPVQIMSQNNEKCFIVDGGVLSNFPVWIFDTDNIPKWPTIGFKLVSPNEGKPAKIRGPLSLSHAIINTMLEAHDMRHVKHKHAIRTIFIETNHVKTTSFDLTIKDKKMLYQSGEEAAKKFLSEWNFTSYVEGLRRKKEG